MEQKEKEKLPLPPSPPVPGMKNHNLHPQEQHRRVEDQQVVQLKLWPQRYAQVWLLLSWGL